MLRVSLALLFPQVQDTLHVLNWEVVQRSNLRWQCSNSVEGLGDAFEIAAGGGAGDDYAVVSVGNSTSGLVALGTSWTLSGVTYNIEDKADVMFTYTLHQDAGDAVNEESPLNTQSGLLIKFSAATGMAGKATTNAKEIDVASSGLLFVGGSKVSTIMEINLTTTAAGAIDPDRRSEESNFVYCCRKCGFNCYR